MRHFVLYHNEEGINSDGEKRGKYDLEKFGGRHSASYNKRKTVEDSKFQTLWIIVGEKEDKKKPKIYSLAAKLKPIEKIDKDEFSDLTFWAEGKQLDKPVEIKGKLLESIKKVTANFIGYTEIKDQSITDGLDRLIGANKQGSQSSIVYPDEVDVDSVQLTEGAKKQVVVNAYERNQTAREECIKHWKAVCSACEMNFEETYGHIGKGFIHVHHIKPIAEIGETYVIDPRNDLVPVCPNCHAMLHKKNPPYTVGELKSIIRSNK